MFYTWIRNPQVSSGSILPLRSLVVTKLSNFYSVYSKARNSLLRANLAVPIALSLSILAPLILVYFSFDPSYTKALPSYLVFLL